nr:FtsX-like permease family protein [Marinimicrobium sp. ABcell2]
MLNTSFNGFMEMDHHGLDAMGLELLEGRNFLPEEITYHATQATPAHMFAIVTESAATSLFPDQSAVGQTVYAYGEVPTHIVGVVRDAIGPFPNADLAYRNFIFSSIGENRWITYLLRTQREDREKVLTAAANELMALDPTRTITNEETLEDIRKRNYSADYAMIILLSAVISLLIFVNMLGIVGITTFWVNQRRKQIGIRRALGATRADIMRYFLLENSLLVFAATACGAMIAFWASHYLVRNYAFDFLPWVYIPFAGLSVLVITLLAAAVPAQRAARISPSEAVASS